MHVLRKVGAIFLLLPPAVALAVQYMPDAVLRPYVMPLLGLGVLSLAGLTAAALYLEGRMPEGTKRALMWGFMLAVLVPTLFTAGVYVHQLFTTYTGGEVHYHADYEVVFQGDAAAFPFQPSERYDPPQDQCKATDGEYLCQLDLIDPSRYCQRTEHESTYMCRLNDRTGTVEYHEHNDRRIHLEGSFKTREDATLAAFFRTFGGALSDDLLIYPTNEKVYRFRESADDPRTVKIIVQRGVGGDRHWCVLGTEAPPEDICRNQYGSLATGPSDYVISPFQTGPNLDDIWIIVDDRSATAALEDLREDGAYRGMVQVKGGEGY